MALNIKNPEVERLAAEIAKITGESKTEAMRRALEERRERLRFRVVSGARGPEFVRFLEEEVWPKVEASRRGKRVTKKEREAILGYGESGV